jgi:sec-independent protein translocase protein TatB
MSLTPPIEVATIGMWDSLILMVMALVVFGPRRLPEIGRQIGKLMYEVRKASNDFKFQMEEELRRSEDAERKSREQGSGIREQIPAAIESPYPGEGDYPAVSPAEFHSDEPYPRVQPPSTGETVAAARPEFIEQQIQESGASNSSSEPSKSLEPAEAAQPAEQVRHD